VIKCRLTEHLENTGFISKNQAGFRHGHSTYDQIYRLRKDIQHKLSQRKHLPVVFLDIVKAFDRVQHDRLLYKLYNHAHVSGRAWSWIRAFLTDRQFYVSCGRIKSNPVFARAGVPQGTVLAPLLFLIYINDLIPSGLSYSPTFRMNAAMFADDVSAWPSMMVKRMSTQYRYMQNFLDYCTKWSEYWKLEFSMDKTQVVLFHRKRTYSSTLYPSRCPLWLCNRIVMVATSYKYLGLTFDSNGSHASHVTQLITKTKITAYQISQIFKRNRAPTPIIAYKLIQAILIPQISYGIHFITNIRETHRNQLHQVIATPLRRALCLPRTSSAKRVIWEFGLPDVGNIQLRSLYQFYNRSLLSFNSNPFILPSMFASDVMMMKYTPTPDPTLLSSSVSSSTSTSTSASASSVICSLDSFFLNTRRLNPTLTFPIQSQTIFNNHIIQRIISHWDNTARMKYRDLKPLYDTPLYLSKDRMPAAVIRGRIRLGAALSFKRMWQHRTIDSPKCPRCSVSGDTYHLLMVCPRFRVVRSKCKDELKRLYFPVELTMNLIYGMPPPLPTNHHSFFNKKSFLLRIHEQCLRITGDLLCNISTRHFL